MARRGKSQKYATEHEIKLERAMVTRHYEMKWDLDRCVGCQLGPLVCPKDAIAHVEGEIEEGRMVKKQAVDIDAEACVLCGICEIMCPTNAIILTINGEPENPMLVHGTFPELIQSTQFDEEGFDWSRKDFVIMNCPTNVISYDRHEKTMVVDDEHCIRCRQCEVASDGAFKVTMPWQGKVELTRERCVEGCFACADICPTRALHIDEETGELALADYYCIKCGACMEICPIKPEYEEQEVRVESYGVTKTVTHHRISNREELPIWVERWRVRHHPVQSGAWNEILTEIANDRAGMVEIDAKRALKRRDLLKALSGARALLDVEEEE
jgi:4Fe-4S ferredoxin